jgi:hypothetical protein
VIDKGRLLTLSINMLVMMVINEFLAALLNKWCTSHAIYENSSSRTAIVSKLVVFQISIVLGKNLELTLTFDSLITT